MPPFTNVKKFLHVKYLYTFNFISLRTRIESAVLETWGTAEIKMTKQKYFSLVFKRELVMQ